MVSLKGEHLAEVCSFDKIFAHEIRITGDVQKEYTVDHTVSEAMKFTVN